MLPKGAPKLRDIVSSVFIIAHCEDVSALERAMAFEGFKCEVIRGPYSEEQLMSSAAVRCLVNHANAWRRIVELNSFVIVVEADFVPVRGFAHLPLPFIPNTTEKAMAWLYSVGPVIYEVDPENKAIYGHNAGSVAYVCGRDVASDLLEIFDKEMLVPHGDYWPWEVQIPITLRKCHGVKTYIPHRMYGEHGGFTNPEHHAHGVRGWHEADRLAGPLHFLPMYAQNSLAHYKLRRLRGWARGIYRFIVGKYFNGWVSWWNSGRDRYLKLRLALLRLL